MSEKVELSACELEPINSDLVVPEWLDAAFLEKHFQNYFNNKQLKVASFKVEPATARGENYFSYLYRVHVTFVNDILDPSITKISFIVKMAMPIVGLDSTKLLKKESDFYSKIGPKINEALRKLSGIGQLIPDLYGVNEENPAIFLEDLKPKGYGLVSVFRGFNYEETKIILRNLAVFHAINAVLQQEQPDIFANFSTGLINRQAPEIDTFYLTHLDMTIELVSELPDAAYYVNKLQRLRSKLMEKGALAFDPDPSHFNTLIHGDCWVNNIMAKHNNESEINSFLFIDFQYSCWTSPAIDLHYFFNTSLEESLRPDRFDEFIAFYHGHLTNYLESLGYKQQIPTLQQFQQQYLEKSFYAFVTSCLAQPIFLNENPTNLETLMSDDEKSMDVKRAIYSSNKIRNIIWKLVPIYDRIGLFD